MIGWRVVRILGRIYAVLGAAFLAAGMLLGTLVQHLSGAILMLVGTPFLVIGLVLLAVDCRLEKRRKALIESGRFVWAEVTDCVYNYSVSFHNGIHPYQIIACYAGPDGVRHLFRSQNVALCGPREPDWKIGAGLPRRGLPALLCGRAAPDPELCDALN